MQLLLNHSKKEQNLGHLPKKPFIFSSLCCHHLHYSTQLLKLHGLEPNLLTWQRECWAQAWVWSLCKGRCWSSCKLGLPTHLLLLPVDPSWWAGDAEPVFLPQLFTLSFMSKASTFAKAKRWADTTQLFAAGGFPLTMGLLRKSSLLALSRPGTIKPSGRISVSSRNLWLHFSAISPGFGVGRVTFPLQFHPFQKDFTFPDRQHIQ